MDPLRIGILSTANIGNDICEAAKHVKSVKIVAVASRSLEKAAAFAARNNIETFCTYEELLTNEQVEAIYIPLPTAMATAWAVKSAKLGKHVLVDKPFDSADGVRSILAACKESGVAFLDGTHFVHSKRFAQVRRALHDLDPSGTVKRLLVSFSMPLEENMSEPAAIRSNPQLEPAGALGDLGWYACRLFVGLIGPDACQQVSHVSCIPIVHSQFPGVMMGAEAVLRLANGTTLLVDCDATGPVRQCYTAVTRTGCVRVVDFVLPEMRHPVFKDIRPASGYPSKENGFDVERSAVVLEDGKTRMIWPQRTHVDSEEGGNQSEALLEEFGRLARNDEDSILSRVKWSQEALVSQMLLDKLVLGAHKVLEAEHRQQL